MPTRRRTLSPHLAVAYVRVSTDDQQLGPEAQRAALERWAAATGTTFVAILEDIGVSGATPLPERPGLVAALAMLESSGAASLVVAKQGRLVIDPASPMLNKPPTDPTALAAWLYGRVVPGHTVVEWTEPSVDRIRTRKAFISALEQDVDHIVLWPHGDSALYVPPPANHTHRATKLVNPDGTVLWEARS